MHYFIPSCSKFVGNLEILYSSQIKKLIPREVKIAGHMAIQTARG